ncbi:phenylacetate--CoA ligase family protein [Flagellimonas sp. 389]|uniref:phenylacetate--CoA ligase family protein n=1 Tax=Flagellimonas sp. 389 TaxID=2835862 RepID=UPI001BD67DAC|nr:hypothetical protein [Flagellimonas sp. 389]MBS9462205.1 phenylacetate--CoA ligase family protein [Flagellimonas sp. 389]
MMLNTKALSNYNRRYNKDFKKYFKNFKCTWTLSLEEIKEYQKKQLIDLLLECFTFSEWYKEIFHHLKINEDDIKNNPYEVLKKLPILQKTVRKSEVESIINKNPERQTAAVGYTSGTSGSPTKNYMDKESINISFALWKRFHHVIGFNSIHPKTVRFSGNIVIPVKTKKPPFWLYNIFEKQLYMSTYHLTDENIPKYIEKLNNFKPKLLDGYPSAMFTLANYINQKKIDLKFSPIAIATTSETLYDEQRIAIEKAFNCRVYNQYASSEGSPFITECINGNLHLNLDSGVFELLDENYNPALPGSVAKLVVTSFRNMKTPLIRYDIKDSVLIPKFPKSCNCGCQMPMVEKIVGREDDLLIANNDSYIGMSAYKVFKYAKHLKNGQIVQKSKYLFVINIEITDDFNESDKEFLEEKVKSSFGENSKVEIVVLDKIPLGANGKFKAVIRDF